MRFSIIMPVYNVEKYIKNCFESIVKQNFSDYEIIVINDGSTDSSQEIINEFKKMYPEKISCYIKENGGLSDTRNYGIDKAKGEYLVFVDSDDYIDETLLYELDKKIKKKSNLEMVRIPCRKLDKNKKIITIENNEEDFYKGEELFRYLRKNHICIETAWSYCVKKFFWENNKLEFPKGKLHEDFAVMLLALLKAENTATIQKKYYNYIVRDNSIINNKNYDNIVKKVLDKLEHYDNIKKELEFIDVSCKTKEICLEYISTAVCFGIIKLKGEDKKIYIKELRKRNVIENIKYTSLRNVIKKIIFSILIL